MRLSFLTINAHKGFSALNRRFMLPQLRECVHEAGADVVFMQEVVGQNLRHAERYFGWPAQPQHEYLAERSGYHHAYGRNAVYTAGHHGNALLSRFPILHHEKADISTNRLEQRGLLYAVLALPDGRSLHCVCLHLNLLHRSRRRQFAGVAEFIARKVPPGAPLVVGGDFNEWRPRRRDELQAGLGLRDAGLETHGRRLRTFPAVLPALPLDRIYFRGLEARSAEVLHRGPWRGVSDHAALLARLELADQPYLVGRRCL